MAAPRDEKHPHTGGVFHFAWLRERELNPLPPGYEPGELPSLPPAEVVYTSSMAKAKIAILGFGREGRSLLEYLRSSPRYADAEFWVLDKNEAVASELPNDPRVHDMCGPRYLTNLTRFHTLFRSPGISYTLPQLVAAKRKGVRISSATKLFFDEIQNVEPRPPMLIGVTGSKGKGTTATLLHDMLVRSGFRALLAGNIGKPMLDVLSEAGEAECVILELSSFQLQDLHVSPHIAVVLDIFPEHLDIHKTVREYLGAKMRIGKYQTNRDRIFYFIGNDGSREVAMKSLAQKTGVNPGTEGIAKNYEMAAAVARFMECPETIIERAIREFKGLPYRLEKVRTMGEVAFYNDSAATNPYATAAAIRSFRNPTVLIAGGRDKQLDYTPLAKAIAESAHVTHIILFGENREKIKTAVGRIVKRKVTIEECGDLKSAIALAHKIAKKLASIPPHRSATVLFSPASASFDMFKSYVERGEIFTSIVQSLK